MQASPAWTTDDLVSYMENVGRHKIWQTNWILYNEIGPQVDDTWFLHGNTHGWGDIREALDDIMHAANEIYDDVNEEVLPMLRKIARVTAASETYTNEGWMHGWDTIESVDVGVGKVGRFTVSYAGETVELALIDAEAWIWLSITSDGTYYQTVETIHLSGAGVHNIPYRTYEFVARGFRIRVLLHTQAGKTLTLNYAYFYEVLP